jgi:N-acetyl-1-D-myo-inositol-2-amino-2-deoxy-alpha-D-glucopyranoside deacetylase
LVHAHPDDESITTGGLLARCSELGIRSMLVCCTDGRYGPVSPGYGRRLAPDELAEVRRTELDEAAKILGISELRWFGHHDSDMTGSPRNTLPGAFWSQPAELLIGEIVGVVRQFRPQAVVTYDPFGSTGHPDHVQAHRTTLLGVEAAAEARAFPDAGAPWAVGSLWYPVFPVSALEKLIRAETLAGRPHPFDGKDVHAINYGRPDEIVTHRVDIQAVFGVKERALHAHASQIGAHYPALYLAALARREHEHFRLAHDNGFASLFNDLFAEVGR